MSKPWGIGRNKKCQALPGIYEFSNCSVQIVYYLLLMHCEYIE
ncbi:hypothetical protein SRABI111_01797 [Pseudomonas carnis]|jgi:hypothetical protein|nr:hypothetical protein SRABI111_01797 [Pseudomonas carnis]CAH0243609.1 hypothetical protein SRABI08_02926 [Pseudomonas carnis]CAH0292952.1 hypothetical protein SRABI110_04408 [Pseudomonas carnis]